MAKKDNRFLSFIKKTTKKVIRQDKTEEELSKLKAACKTYKRNRSTFVKAAEQLFLDRKVYWNTINDIQKEISDIHNIPEWGLSDLGNSLIRLDDFSLAVQFEKHPEEFAAQDKSGLTTKLMGLGAAAGGATAILGPTTAMSVATVLGTASTGTAISALSGVAATNAALAWLGGGTVAAGAAGMAGGKLLLAMFGPVGVAIASASTTAGILALRHKNKKQAEELHSKIDVIKHDNEEIRMKTKRLNDLRERSKSLYEQDLLPSLEWCKKVHPKDFEKWGTNDRKRFDDVLCCVSNTVLLINERV